MDLSYGKEYLLLADDYYYPGGETDYINFRADIVEWPQGLDHTDQTFMITN